MVCAQSLAQLLTIPPRPEVSPDGLQLIYDYEVGGGKAYYDRFLRRPEWPGGYSGVTVGVGYDLGYNSQSVILRDWHMVVERERLAGVAGITGQRAKAALGSVRDILISWDLANGVFQDVTLARFWGLTQRTFPGFEKLRPNAQAALVSLVFNRGSSLVGESRREMRAIKALVPSEDYKGIAGQIRAMKHLWPLSSDVGLGLQRRRESEARLMETP